MDFHRINYESLFWLKAATALENDGKIISTDQQFKIVQNLELLDPEDCLNYKTENKTNH